MSKTWEAALSTALRDPIAVAAYARIGGKAATIVCDADELRALAVTRAFYVLPPEVVVLATQRERASLRDAIHYATGYAARELSGEARPFLAPFPVTGRVITLNDRTAAFGGRHMDLAAALRAARGGFAL